MNRASSLLILCSLAASASVLNALPNGELLQHQQASRSQEDVFEPEEEEDVVFPLMQPEEGAALMQEEEEVPPPGYGNLVGPGRHYCRKGEGWMNDDSAANESDCAARCNETTECQYFSFWREGEDGRCRLTETCHRFSGRNGVVIIVFEKLPRDLITPAGYSLSHGPSKDWCRDRSYYHGHSDNVTDCAAKCTANIACQYFSYWRTDHRNYCRLTLFCRSYRQHEHSIAIFAKPAPVAPPAPAGYNLSHGVSRDYCGDHSSYNGRSEGLEDCAAKCDAKVACRYFSYWQTHSQKWCRLTIFCNRLRQTDEKIVIYSKPPPVAVVPDGMNLSYSLGPGRDYCADSSTYNGQSEGFDDCANKCNQSSDCGFFSYWVTHDRKWCRITLFCNTLRQQDHLIFIYKKPPPVVPPTPVGFQLAHGTSRNYCKENRVWQAYTTGLDDCAGRCRSYWSCEFFSLWQTGGRNLCRLSRSCANYSQDNHYIVIFDKLPQEAPQSPGVYNLTHGPARDYCADHSSYNGGSTGLEDCAAKCDARVDCQFFSFWQTGGRNFCRTTLFCRTYRQQNEHILIYAKPPPQAPAPVDNYTLVMGPGRDYCSNHASFNTRSSGYEDCASKCTEKGANCQYFSFWRTGGNNHCRLTLYCDTLRQTDASIVIYGKPTPVTPPAPMRYNLTHNLSRNFCRHSVWNGNTKSIDECAGRCDDNFHCNIFQYWVTGTGDNHWCRLSSTSNCAEFSQQEHYIAIYTKSEVVAPDAPEGYSMTHGPARDYCYPGHRVFSGPSESLEDCTAKCDERQNCVYVNFYLTGGQNYCNLYTTCTGYRQTNHHIVMYKKGSPTAPAGYEVSGGINMDYCDDLSTSFKGVTESLEACANLCDGRPECHFFSYWIVAPWGGVNCWLSSSCNQHSQQNYPIVIIAKTLPALTTSPPGYNVIDDEGNKFCAKVRFNKWQGYAERDACVAACGADPSCKYFSHSQPYTWCILSTDCDLKLKATVDMGYKIYEKAD